MSDQPGQLPEPIDDPARQRGWPVKRLLILSLIVVAAQAAFIVIVGEKKEPATRTATNAPHFQITNPGSDLIALDDPTLFALPHNNDFAAATWLGPLPAEAPTFTFDEAPRWLDPGLNDLGADLRQYLLTNTIAVQPPSYKPTPALAQPAPVLEPDVSEPTTMQIRGDLASRRRLAEPDLPSLTNSDLVGHSRVQILVDAAGDVVSAVKLPTGSLVALPDDPAAKTDGDNRALELVRQLRFAATDVPAMFGQVTFNWHTVLTNAP